MTGYLFLLLALTTTLIFGAGVWVVSRAKKMLDDPAPGGRTDRFEANAKFLADNWAMVERTGLENGMTAAELAEVRRKIFEAS